MKPSTRIKEIAKSYKWKDSWDCKLARATMEFLDEQSEKEQTTEQSTSTERKEWIGGYLEGFKKAIRLLEICRDHHEKTLSGALVCLRKEFEELNRKVSPTEKEQASEEKDFVTDCCGSPDFDPFGFDRGDGTYDERCGKCGGKTDVHYGVVGEAKPQEEPKCENGCPKDEINWDACSCPCHQKESEPKERYDGIGLDEYGFLKDTHIVLEKPANMSIADSIALFDKWLYEERGEFYSEKTDPDFLKLWQEWLSTKK